VTGYQSTEGGFPGLIALRQSAPTPPSQDPSTALPGRTPAATPIASPTRTPHPAATPAPDSASLTVRALACPVAYEGNDFAAACAEPLVGIGFRLVIPATEFSREGTTDAEGTVAFRGLGENTYALSGGVPAEFAVQTVACADDDGPIPVEPPYSEIPGGTVELGAGAGRHLLVVRRPRRPPGRAGRAASPSPSTSAPRRRPTPPPSARTATRRGS
jgi:hypothetical protein